MALWVVLRSLFLIAMLKKLASLAVDVARRRRFQDEGAGLEWLQTTLPLLRATLSDAEQRQIKDESVSLWLRDIKDLAYDAEDVLDELEYEELRHRVEGGASQGSGTPTDQARVHRLNEIRQRWDGIASRRNNLRIGDLGSPANQGDHQEGMAQTSSLLKEAIVFGRENETDEIVQFLLATDGEIGTPAVAITGAGGFGKTTLAQLVYNDERVTKHFDLKMWICVTAPEFDVEILTRDILASSHRCLCPPWMITNLDVLQRNLKEKLNGMRFLLVVDNLWDRNYSKWQCLCAPLIHGEKGSKVVITTRDMKVADILQTRKMVQLQGLPFDDCWRLFKRYAFPDGNSVEHPSLEAIGKHIVQKFDGAPLAAMMIGGVLRSKLDQNEWMRILESEMWELEVGEDGILPVLKLSYEQLPPRLKQCFAYCALCQKNYAFDKRTLVQQWMAQGLLRTGGNSSMEDVGAKYLDDLLNRSFFHRVHDGKFVMHDLIHDLAHLVSKHDHLITRIDDGARQLLKGTPRPHHVSVFMSPGQQPDQTGLRDLSKCRNLRTIIFVFPVNHRFQFSDGLFLSFKALRVLDLSFGGILTLPESIRNLIHLRYLDLDGNFLTRLPESLCCLYHLQTLKLGRGNLMVRPRENRMERLPRGISNLINLRHLEAPPYLLSKVAGIGKLTCLQELASFPISGGHGIKIQDLRDMNELEGALRISNLQRVTSMEEAARAMLKSKRRLRKLAMGWDGAAADRDRQLEEETLEALSPPENLKELDIDGYDGARCPSWMENQSISKQLESLRLSGCRNLNSLHLLWCLPSLRALEIVNCSRLRELPSLPSTLRTLKICDVGLEELPEFYLQPPQPVVGSSNNCSPSLSALRIYRCPALRSLKQGLLRHYLGNLTTLSIQRCMQLVNWPESAGFRATLLSVEELCVEFCPKLVALTVESTLSRSLRRLSIVGCPGVASKPLFGQLHGVSPEATVSVEKTYTSLACCSEEALQLMRTVDLLEIDDAGYDFDNIDQYCRDDRLVSLVYDKQRVWSWRCNHWVSAWRLQVGNRGEKEGELKKEEKKEEEASNPHISHREWWERRSPPVRVRRSTGHDGGDVYSDGSLLSSLGDDPRLWGSLRWLVVKAILNASAFLSLDLSSLEGLWICRCRDTRLLSSGSPLSRLTGLKELQIFDCPEVTLPSLQQLIRSLPSLQHLTIEACPNLSSSSSSSSSQCSTHPATASPSTAATLQTLFVDDANLLGDAPFVHEQLTSLRGLHVWFANLAFFTAAAVEGLGSIGKSLQHLSIQGCRRLQYLPPGLRSLLPSLKVLSIKDCPSLRCLPEGGLPTTLKMVLIYWCRGLEGRCESPSPYEEQDDQRQQLECWPEIAHVPVVIVDGYILKGSYREFLELKEEWLDF